MRYLIRIEHKDSKVGPYQGSKVLSITDHGDCKHPSPQRDEYSFFKRFCKLREKKWEYFPNMNLLFGFCSMRQLLEWFDNDEIEEMHEKDYVARVYPVKKGFGIKSEKQAVVMMSDETSHIREISLDKVGTLA